MKFDETAQLMEVQCHSLSVGHRIRGDEVAWWKNQTHKLFVKEEM